MLRTAFAKEAAPDVPATDATGKNHLHRVLSVTILAIKAGGKAKLAAGSTQQARSWLGEQLFAGSIH